MLPPRDYPDTNRQGLATCSNGEKQPVTVRAVLDRLDSKQPITDAMINTAVTNLFTADAHVITEAHARGASSSTNAQADTTAPRAARVRVPRVPRALSALFNSVRRN